MSDLVGKVDSQGRVLLGRRRVLLSSVLRDLGQEQRHAEEKAARMQDPAFARDAFFQAMIDVEFDDSLASHVCALREIFRFDPCGCATVSDVVTAAIGDDAAMAGAYLAARDDVLEMRRQGRLPGA